MRRHRSASGRQARPDRRDGPPRPSVRGVGGADVAGIERAAVLAPARDGEVPRSALDAARAEMQLGWKPWTDLATGSAAVLEYFRKKP